jgi:hypothetical protein
MLTNAQISKLSDIVVNDIERLFRYFKIPYYSGQNKVYTACMIHDSDKFNSLSIYIGGYQVPFIWKCRTHHCENTFKKTVIGFTRALLSSANGWTCPDDKKLEVSFGQTIKFLCELYKVDISHIKENAEEVEKNKFVYMANRSKLRDEPNKTKAKPKVSREKVRGFLKIPAEYYLKKGYSPEIIDKYDIGLCDSPRSDMCGRIVIPIYDETGQFMVGCTGRSIYEKCEKCKCHHPEGACPTNLNLYSKWRHNFESRHHLYNYWFAYPTIKQTSSALLVESPGNVLKLEMAGIHNSLAMFGNALKTEQKFLLEKAGVMDLTVLLDNDPAGQLGREMIEKECSMYYNLRFIDLPGGVNDVGEMSVNDIKNLKI